MSESSSDVRKEVKAFQERFKKERERMGLSQTDLAEKFGVTKTTISGYERAERKPDFEMLCDIANLFDKPIDYLVGRTDIDKPVDVDFIKSLLYPYEESDKVKTYTSPAYIFTNLIHAFFLKYEDLDLKGEGAFKIAKILETCTMAVATDILHAEDLDNIHKLVLNYSNDTSLKELLLFDQKTVSIIKELSTITSLPAEVFTSILQLIQCLSDLYSNKRNNETLLNELLISRLRGDLSKATIKNSIPRIKEYLENEEMSIKKAHSVIEELEKYSKTLE